MIKFRWLAHIFIIVLFIGCTSTKQVKETGYAAKTNFELGNYADALAEYETIIAEYVEQRKTDECPVYSMAGISAINLDQTQKGLQYLKQATYTPFADENTYAAMARTYRNIDNLSLEIEALEAYVGKFPSGAEIDQMKNRLFETYVESENWDLAYDLWPEIEAQVKMEIKYIEDYYHVNNALDNAELVEQLAGQLLDMNDENLAGLEFMAKKYYNIAENRYQEEMAKYEENKTRTQYAKLLEALDETTADFKISLGYFESLYSFNPRSTYANYMGNIYARFNDQEKADFYHNLSKEK